MRTAGAREEEVVASLDPDPQSGTSAPEQGLKPPERSFDEVISFLGWGGLAHGAL